MSMPGILAEGEVYDAPVSALDLLPTAMALGDIEVPARCEGVNLIPYLTGTSKGIPHATLYWRVSGGDGYAIRDGNWKLVKDVGMKTHQLFDLSTDTGEDRDRSSSHPDLVKKLDEKYRNWSRKLERPRWTEGHTQNTVEERKAAEKAGARQYPMKWAN